MTHPDIEDLTFGELRQEAFLCGNLLEQCKRRLREPRNVTEFVKARDDLPFLRSHMRRVTGAYMRIITLRN